jgi:site-specific DNA-cytosine methylase
MIIVVITGAGGFGTGLDMSGFVKTMWAVEWDSSAAATFRFFSQVLRCRLINFLTTIKEKIIRKL